jgi:hypothetical protein
MLYANELSLLSADPGMGKGLICADVVARLSHGLAMPDGTTGFFYRKKVRSLILSREDSASRVIKPRLRAAGADESMVAVYNSELKVGRDLHRLRATIQEIKPAFVILDPIGSYTNKGTDTNSDSQIRELLDPLADLAEQMHVLILLIRHLAKAGGKEAQGTKKLYRGLGSIGYAGRVRSELMLQQDKDENRFLRLTKNNFGSDERDGLLYKPRNKIVFFDDQGFGSRPFAPGVIQWAREITPVETSEKHMKVLIEAIREKLDVESVAGYQQVREATRFNSGTMDAAVKYLVRTEPSRFCLHESFPGYKGRVIQVLGPKDLYPTDDALPNNPCRHVHCEEVA